MCTCMKDSWKKLEGYSTLGATYDGASSLFMNVLHTNTGIEALVKMLVTALRGLAFWSSQ